MNALQWEKMIDRSPPLDQIAVAELAVDMSEGARAEILQGDSYRSISIDRKPCASRSTLRKKEKACKRACNFN